MRTFILLSALASISFVGACSASENSSTQPKQAVFATQAEAEAAAPGFGCEGAHKMGNMWMVCASHDSAENADQQGHNSKSK